jgi:hypothetical protein
MQHLTPERIAALADEPATLAERTHLASCAACTAGLTAAQRLIRMAITDIPAIERPISSWERIGPALRAEGLVRTPAGRGAGDIDAPGIPAGGMRWRRAVQIAAGLFLAVGGAVVGRASAGLPSSDVASATPAAEPGFGSTSEALEVLDRASANYQRAVAYLAANDSTVTLSGRDAAELYQARLDALDRAATATRAALYRAPDDPVLNQYYLSTMGARDLTLRQMGEFLSVSSAGRVRY